VEKHFLEIIKDIGEDASREGLRDTPRRAAEAFRFLTRGYDQDIKKIVNNAIFESAMSEMVIVKDIELYSLCEHHLLPFIGKIIGISKLARMVDLYARRLQVQEKLTQQIAETIMEATEAAGVGVIIEAKHLCMMMRGVEKQNSVMKTSMMMGLFRSDNRTRSEFLELVK
jgi:GTP cyclohydrolase IA